MNFKVNDEIYYIGWNKSYHNIKGKVTEVTLDTSRVKITIGDCINEYAKTQDLIRTKDYKINKKKTIKLNQNN